MGTAQFGLRYGIANRGAEMTLEAARAIVARAWAGGIDTLDTAIAYGDSETRLGRIGVSQWRVVSKLPSVPSACRNVSTWVLNTAEESRQRLGIDAFYAFLLHRPEQLLEPGGDRIYAALVDMKARGTVAKIGFSIYTPSELDALFDRYPPDIIQAPFNILDRRLVHSGWASRLQLAGVEVHARSVFLQGLLLMDPADRPARFDRWEPTWSKWHEWLTTNNLAPLEACIRYALSVAAIDRVVVGVDTLPQLEEILESARNSDRPIPVPDELRVDDAALVNPANWDALSS